MNQEHYQIYENGHPLGTQIYTNIRQARVALRAFPSMLENQASVLGYKVEQRSTFIPVRNTLGVRRTYVDGTSVDITYVIRTVRLHPSFVNF